MGSRPFVAYPIAALGTVALATAVLRWLGVVSPTTVALTYLLVVLFTASFTTLAVAVGTSIAQHPGRVRAHRTLLRAIWGPNAVSQPLASLPARTGGTTRSATTR